MTQTHAPAHAEKYAPTQTHAPVNGAHAARAPHDPNRRSALALAIEARPRTMHTFPLVGFTGLGDKPIGSVGVWVNTKAEQDESVIAAHRRIADETSDAVLARTDPDLTLDAKTLEVLFRACRDADDSRYPAFPGTSWMREHLTTTQIGGLLNLYNEVVKRDGGIEADIGDERVEAYARLAADNAGTDIPEAVLATCGREYLTQLVVLLSVKLDDARRALAATAGPAGAQDAPAGEPSDAETP